MSEPSAATLTGWRITYGVVLTATVRGEEYYFRLPTVKEHEAISAKDDDPGSDTELELVETCLLHPDPEILDRRPAGVVTSLSDEILRHGGFVDATTLADQLHQERNRQDDDVKSLMYAFIISTQPTYTVEDLKSRTVPELLSLLVTAEKIIEVRQATQYSQDVKFGFQFEQDEPQPEPEANQGPRPNSGLSPDGTVPPGEARDDDPVARRLLGGG